MGLRCIAGSEGRTIEWACFWWLVLRRVSHVVRCFGGRAVEVRFESETMRVMWLDFNDLKQDWVPDEPWNCEFWVTVDVGDENGSVCFKVHVCTPATISRIENKRHCFLIDEYLDRKILTDQLDRFIAETTQFVSGDPYRELGRFWLWEYGRYDSRGHLLDY